MIFITLGTQDKSFIRLLEEIDRLCEIGQIHETIVVQGGYTKFHSKYMQIFDYVGRDQFESYMQDCRILVTHGGVGSILSGLQHQKKVLAVARLSRYDEHENDHQLQIVGEFSKRHYIVGCNDAAAIRDKWQELAEFTPVPFHSNQSYFCDQISKLIG